jgi:hypothetical protein
MKKNQKSVRLNIGTADNTNANELRSAADRLWDKAVTPTRNSALKAALQAAQGAKLAELAASNTAAARDAIWGILKGNIPSGFNRYAVKGGNRYFIPMGGERNQFKQNAAWDIYAGRLFERLSRKLGLGANNTDRAAQVARDVFFEHVKPEFRA